MSAQDTRGPMSVKEAAAACGGSIALAFVLVAADQAGLWGHGRVPYSNGGGCDIWFYFSQIISPQTGNFLAEGTRFISRPLYVVPPHLLKTLFPALDPNQAAFLVFLPLATAALYLGLRALFGRATSAAGALLIGSAPLLVNMASGTYVPMGAAAYAICMLACLLWTGRLADARPIPHLAMAFLGGLFFAFAANANVMSIKFDFTYVLFALPVARQPLPRLAALTARAAGAFVVGAGVGILFTLALSSLLGLGFYTPLQQVVEALGGIEQARHPNWQHESVGFALIAVICVLAACACHRQRAPRALLIGAVAIGTSAFHLVAFLAFGDMNLAFDWWYFMLLPLVALAFCAALADRIEAEPATALLALAGTIIGANLLLSHLHFLKQLLFDDAAFVAYVVIAALAASLAWWRGRAGNAGAVAFVALSLQAAHSSVMHQHYFRSYADQQGQARATEGAVKLILAHARERPVVWIAATENHGLDLTISRSLIRCPYEGSFPDKLPDPKVLWQPALEPGRTLVLIDGKASQISEIQAALARYGMTLDVAASRYFWRVEGVTPGVQVTVGKVR
jgi:hypothetical protein